MFGRIYSFLFLILLCFYGCKREERSDPVKPLLEKDESVFLAQSLSKIVLTYSEWPPYCSESLPKKGVSNQIVKAAFKKVGLDVDLKLSSSWNEAYNQSLTGKVTGSVAWYKAAEREKKFYFSDPLHRVETVIFYRKGMAFDWNTVEDLKAYRIEGTKVYGYGKSIDLAESRGLLNLQRNSTDLEGFERLIAEKSDLFMCSYEVGQQLLKKHFAKSIYDKITFHPLPVTSKNVYLVLNRKDPKNAALIERFNQGLIQLRASGELSNYQQDLSTLPIVSVGTGECAPYSGMQLAGGGFTTEYVEQVMALAGYTVKTDFYPWRRCEDLLQRGGLEIIFPYVDTEKRRENYFFSNPIATTTGSFYINRRVLSELPDMNSLKDLVKLKKFRVVGLRGYYMNEDLEKYGIQVNKVNYVQQAIQLIENGRCDIAVLMDSEYFVMLQNPKNSELEKIIKVVKAPWWTQRMGMMVSKKNPRAQELILKINKALKIAEQRKYLDKIMAEQKIPILFK